jgi:hypothetical protein
MQDMQRTIAKGLKAHMLYKCRKLCWYWFIAQAHDLII